MSEDLRQVSGPKCVNMFFFCFRTIIAGLAFAGLSCLESGGINADCMPQHFLSVLFFFFISFVQVIMFSRRACEVVWGCSVPWEYLPLTLHGCLAFIPKAKPLNGEVFC